jgi:CubicO group peptidase (beta-lactamase class C family)
MKLSMQKTLSLLLLFIIAGIILSAQTMQDKQLANSLDELVSPEFKPTEPGIAILIAKNRQVVYEKAFGSANTELNTPLQPDMVFRIGSITKQFTAIAILQLAEQGKISLQDSLQKYIKDFPSKGYTITIENLLTHTSGIMDYSNADTTHNPYIEREDFTPQRIIKYFNYQPLEFKPGTKYNYSNSGYVLLAYIIEKVTGKNYHDYMEANVINRAGLTHTLYANENTIVPKRVRGYTRDRGFYENAEYQTLSIGFGCGDLLSTVEDLYQWNNALLDYKLVKKETLDKAFTPFKLDNEIETGYGYGWFINEVNGKKCIHHEGQVSGFIAAEQYFPDNNVYVSIITNLQSGEDTTDFSTKRFELVNKISRLAIGKELPKEITVKDIRLDDYIGTYSLGKEEFTITKNKDHLVINVPTGGHFDLIPVSADKFVLRNVSPECTLEFIKDNLGNIIELISVQNGVFSWVKIAESNSPNANENSHFEGFAGKYQLLTMQGAFMTITTKDNHLMTESTTGLAKAELVPVAENKYKYNDPNNDLLFEFVKGKKGWVNKIIVTQAGERHIKKIK